MIAHFGIQQGTEEWYAIKHGKIGGTRAKHLFSDTDTMLNELIGEMVEEFEMDYDSYESDDMIRGKMLEPEARKAISDYVGVNFLECGWLESEECGLLGISVDGITADFESTVEIKCPGLKRHTATVRSKEIPLDNVRQSIHYFTVNPLCRKHYFVSYRPEFTLKPLFVKLLTRDSIVNIGTKSRPVNVTVQQACDAGLSRAREIEKQVREELESLKF